MSMASLQRIFNRLLKRNADLAAALALTQQTGHGVFIGINDRNGTPIRIGDRLRFDGKERGAPCEFVIEISEGKLQYPGAPSDLENWCEVID